MDELPTSAKALLARARAAEQLPEGAQERVRAAVAVAIGVGVGTATAASSAAASTTATVAKAGLFSSSFAKVAAIGGVLATLGTSAVLVRSHADGERRASTALHAEPHRHAQQRQDRHALPDPRASSAESGAAPNLEAPQPTQQPAEPSQAHAADRRNTATNKAEPHHAPPSLHDEMMLLSQASAALDRRDLRTAHKLLHRHVQRYERGQLVPERLGLQVLAACLSQPAAAASGARAYLQMSPDAVLATRVASACKLEREP